MGRPRNSIERMLREDVDASGDCWVWKGPLGHNGYGKATILKKLQLAHRVFYAHFKGPIPDGYFVNHLCKNRQCVNPAHLEAVTPEESIRRGDSPCAINARKLACIRGHALTGGNLYITPDGRRQCRCCRSTSVAKRLGKETHFA